VILSGVFVPEKEKLGKKRGATRKLFFNSQKMNKIIGSKSVERTFGLWFV